MTSHGVLDHRLALATLNLNTTNPCGTEPDIDELDEWRLGRVPEPRASEILSHVAASTELAVMVAELERVLSVESEEDSSDEGSPGELSGSAGSGENVVSFKPRSLTSRGSSLFSPRHFAFFGSALAACLAMVLIWPQPGQHEWPGSKQYGWIDERNDRWMAGDPVLSGFPQFRSKSIGAPHADTAAARTGARWVALTLAMGDTDWKAWANTGPTVDDLCEDGKCDPRYTLMLSTGRWLFQVYTECRRQGEAIEKELAVLERVITLGEGYASPLIETLSTARGQTGALCEVSGDVLGLS